MTTAVKVNWKGRLSFDGTAGKGFSVPLDARQAVGGDEDGFGPMELLAIGLAGCTAMDVISILHKKRQRISDFEVQVNAERAAQHPKVFTEVILEYQVTGQGVDESAVLRAVEWSATRYCPALAMFQNIMPVSLNYTIFEDQENGERRQVVKGGYSLPHEAV